MARRGRLAQGESPLGASGVLRLREERDPTRRRNLLELHALRRVGSLGSNGGMAGRAQRVLLRYTRLTRANPSERRRSVSMAFDLHPRVAFAMCGCEGT